MNEKQKLFMAYGIIPSLSSKTVKLKLTHPNNITDAHCVELFDLLNNSKLNLSIHNLLIFNLTS